MMRASGKPFWDITKAMRQYSSQREKLGALFVLRSAHCGADFKGPFIKDRPAFARVFSLYEN